MRKSYKKAREETGGPLLTMVINWTWGGVEGTQRFWPELMADRVVIYWGGEKRRWIMVG